MVPITGSEKVVCSWAVPSKNGLPAIWKNVTCTGPGAGLFDPRTLTPQLERKRQGPTLECHRLSLLCGFSSDCICSGGRSRRVKHVRVFPCTESMAFVRIELPTTRIGTIAAASTGSAIFLIQLRQWLRVMAYNHVENLESPRGRCSEPVGSEEYLLRQIESPAAVAREAEAPGSNAHVVATEQLTEQTFADIFTLSRIRVAKYKHDFLIREAFRTLLSQAVELRVNGDCNLHARIIVAGRCGCRMGLVNSL